MQESAQFQKFGSFALGISCRETSTDGPWMQLYEQGRLHSRTRPELTLLPVSPRGILVRLCELIVS